MDDFHDKILWHRVQEFENKTLINTECNPITGAKLENWPAKGTYYINF